MFKFVSNQFDRKQVYRKTIPNVFNKVGSVLYILICAQFLWLVSVMAGLIIFGIVPANKTMFQVKQEIKCLKSTDSIGRFPIFQFWWKHIIINLKELWLISWLVSLVQIILTISWIWLSQTQGMITLGLFYFSIFLWFIWAIISLNFTFFIAVYTDMSKKELFRNAYCFPLVLLPEYIIGLTIITVAMNIVWTIVPGLVVFIGLSIFLFAFGIFLEFLQSGYRLKKLFTDWRRIE